MRKANYMNAIEVDIRDTYFRPRYCTGWIYRLGILGETDIAGQVHLSNSFAVFDVQVLTVRERKFFNTVSFSYEIHYQLRRGTVCALAVENEFVRAGAPKGWL